MTTLDKTAVEAACEASHDAYELAALKNGWATNPRSRKPWADVPEENKATVRAGIEAAITAYLDILSSIPEQGVGVKTLEWTKVDNANDDESEEAVTPFGGYVITADPFTYSPTTAYYVDGPDWFKAQCASVPEAKAAAQADYEARIRSALTSHPAAVAVTDKDGGAGVSSHSSGLGRLHCKGRKLPSLGG